MYSQCAVQEVAQKVTNPAWSFQNVAGISKVCERRQAPVWNKSVGAGERALLVVFVVQA